MAKVQKSVVVAGVKVTGLVDAAKVGIGNPFAKQVATAYGSVDLQEIAKHGVDAATLAAYPETFTIDISEAVPVQALNPRQGFGNPVADYNAKWEASDNGTDGKWVDDAGNLKTGCTRFLRTGWKFSEKPAGVLVIGDNAELRKLANEHLDAYIASLEASHPAIAATYKAVYGNRDAIKYVIMQRQRFSHAIPAAIHWRNSQPGAKHSLAFQLSATLMRSDTLRDLLLEAMQENMNAGQVLMTATDLLLLAKRLHDLDPVNFNQNLLLRNNFKKGEAQRIANVIALDKSFPSLRIVERMAMPQPKEGESVAWDDNCPLPLTSFSHVMVTAVRQGFLPGTKNEPIPGGLTKQWLAKWLISVASNGRVKSVSITDVQEKCGGHSVLLLQDLVKAVKSNSLDTFLANLTAKETMVDALNACYAGSVDSDATLAVVQDYVALLEVNEVTDKSAVTTGK